MVDPVKLRLGGFPERSVGQAVRNGSSTLASSKTSLREYGLHSGDHMSREEFHRIYEAMPEDFKAELIGGIVYVASPLKIRHGNNHAPLSTVFYAYEDSTKGVEMGDNATVILGNDAEAQPDLYLRVLPEFGGQSETSAKDYIEGAPVLVAEIALSSHSIDLHSKRLDYARHGVLEYLVFDLQQKRLRWFDLKKNRELEIDEDGICRVRTFPGLWIHEAALLKRNHKRLMRTLKKGLASDEHSAFVTRLKNATTKTRKRGK